MAEDSIGHRVLWVFVGLLVSAVLALGGFGIQHTQQSVGENRKGILELREEVHRLQEQQVGLIVRVEAVAKQVERLSEWHRSRYERGEKNE